MREKGLKDIMDVVGKGQCSPDDVIRCLLPFISFIFKEENAPGMRKEVLELAGKVVKYSQNNMRMVPTSQYPREVMEFLLDVFLDVELRFGMVVDALLDFIHVGVKLVVRK
jgi:hypothetical protein